MIQASFTRAVNVSVNNILGLLEPILNGTVQKTVTLMVHSNESLIDMLP